MDIVRLGTGRMIRFVPGHCKKLVCDRRGERVGACPGSSAYCGIRAAASGISRLWVIFD
jgi:hypothetical protein